MIIYPRLVLLDLMKAEAAHDRADLQRGRWMAAVRDCCGGLSYRLGLRGEPRPLCCSVGAA